MIKKEQRGNSGWTLAELHISLWELSFVKNLTNHLL